LILGCGYLGERVARLAIMANQSVAAVTRSSAKAAVWDSQGIIPYVGDVTIPDSLAKLPTAKVCLYAVGYDRQAAPTQQEVYCQGLRNTWGAIGHTCERFIYVSSTSVYGQTAGEWVDETSPTVPATDGGQICLEAEQILHELSNANRVSGVSLRMAGLYGPDRVIAKAEALKALSPISGRPDSWLNLIHIDDAAKICVAAMLTERPEATYLVSDDQPVLRSEYYNLFARLIGTPEPIFDTSIPPKRGSGGINKRCRNARAKELLAGDWLYPTIKTGLPAAIGNSPSR
jgi:nucleoside-diphosphate-sugar epimerase